MCKYGIKFLKIFNFIYDLLSSPFSLCGLNYVLNVKEQQSLHHRVQLIRKHLNDKKNGKVIAVSELSANVRCPTGH